VGICFPLNTRAKLADVYFEVNQILKAVETMKAVVTEKTWWKPNPKNVTASTLKSRRLWK